MTYSEDRRETTAGATSGAAVVGRLCGLGCAVLLVAACTGDRGRSFARANQDHEDSKAHAQAIVEAQAKTQANQPPGHGAHAHKPGGPANTKALPAQPVAGIRYPAPFDGTPVATSVTPTGIKVEDYVVGTGAAAGNGSKIKVHYTGYLTDGSVFDSSIPRGRPYTLDLGKGRVIKGWDQGLQGMRAGGKRKLTIPPAMGYGDRGKGKIPAGATLVFTLEIVGIAAPVPDPQPLAIFDGTPVSRDARANGLVLIDYKLGTGAIARKGDTVQVHYRGTLKDGTVFDSSYPKKRPIEFRLGVGRVIKGWDEGIAGMRVGGVRTMQIPAVLGYGARGKGKIPANSDLTFNVELMSVAPGVSP